MDTRLQQLTRWLKDALPNEQLTITPLAGDASFRRYFRATSENKSQQWVVMDAPPEHEDCVPFIAIAKSWAAQGINVPEIIDYDLEQGFILLSDFGDTLYLGQLCNPSLSNPSLSNPSLNKQTADKLYKQAIDALINIQLSQPTAEYSLPPYDTALLDREMSLFRDWLLEKQLQHPLSEEENRLLDSVFSQLRANALEQPQVPVHRDYHSRNLMVCEDTPGILDFQDAVQGPITYDLVSLLKDCYIVWPDSDVDTWVSYYLEIATKAGITKAELPEFKRWFHLMGMQRHLKASGIFARLSIRDGKHSYLDDIPRTVDYLVKATSATEGFEEFGEWLQGVVVPKIDKMAKTCQEVTA